ncbi:MAG TPA: ATP synthase F1 subunit delta [Thermoanaerobaculia bacterium]|nr:ATP synthase F1 subunit delta [Thermoanaerobaculia bacterium]
MKSVDDRNLGLGRLYAQALLDLADEQGNADELLEELTELARYLESHPDLVELFGSPLVEADTRAATIEKLFRGRASDLLVDALQVINRKGRLGSLRAIAEAYRQELRDRRGQVDVLIRTAVPLTGGLRARLSDSLAQFTGRTPTLIEKVDPSVIGGLVVEVAGTKIDTSVASRLKSLGAALERRASEEIHRGTAAYTSE